MNDDSIIQNMLVISSKKHFLQDGFYALNHTLCCGMTAIVYFMFDIQVFKECNYFRGP